MAYNSHVNIEIYFLGGSDMKKASRIVGLLLPLVMVMALLAGCPTDGDDGDEQGGALLTSAYQTYYLALGDYEMDNSINRLHLKNLSSGPIGIDIQKVYVTKDKSLTANAWPLVDFTLSTDFATCGGEAFYDGTAVLGSLTGSAWEVSAAPAGDSGYIGNFGTGLIYQKAADSVYIAITAKNHSGENGDALTIEFHNEGGMVKALEFGKTFKK
jgi:hypothetical protein